MEKEEKTPANYDERDKIDDEVIALIDQVAKLSKKTVVATLERPHGKQKALENMDRIRRKMYVTISAMTPLAELDGEELPAGDETMATFNKCVGGIAPEMPWAPTRDEQGLTLGEEAASAVDPSQTPPPPPHVT